MTNPWVRELGPDDLSEAAHLHSAAFDAPWSQASLAASLGRPSAFALGAYASRQDAPLSAFCLISPTGSDAELLTIATRPDARRRGHARALMRAAGARLRQAGVKRLLLEVAADNAEACGLYGRLGFQTDGLRSGYYQRPVGRVDAVLMSCETLDLAGG